MIPGCPLKILNKQTHLLGLSSVPAVEADEGGTRDIPPARLPITVAQRQHAVGGQHVLRLLPHALETCLPHPGKSIINICCY